MVTKQGGCYASCEIEEMRGRVFLPIAKLVLLWVVILLPIIDGLLLVGATALGQ